MTEPLPILALITILLADDDVSALVSTRVWGARVPAKQVKGMPQQAIVIRNSGGGGTFGGGWQQYGDGRYDILCYGKSDEEALQVHATVHPLLKALTRTVEAGCRIYWCRQEAGPLPVQDPDAETWFYALSTWQVMAGEVAVT